MKVHGKWYIDEEGFAAMSEEDAKARAGVVEKIVAALDDLAKRIEAGAVTGWNFEQEYAKANKPPRVNRRDLTRPRR